MARKYKVSMAVLVEVTADDDDAAIVRAEFVVTRKGGRLAEGDRIVVADSTIVGREERRAKERQS